MEQIQSYKFKLVPTKEQQQLLWSYVHNCRFVYNWGLSQIKDHYNLTIDSVTGKGKFLSYVDLAKELTDLKYDPDTTFLQDSPTETLQQTLKDLREGLNRVFKLGAGFPRFKKRGVCRNSFTFGHKTSQLYEDTHKIKMPKIGTVKIKNHRKIPAGELCEITVSEKLNKWYASISVKRQLPDPIHLHSDSMLGIDVGVVNFATFSDGRCIQPINSFQKHENRLVIEQRKLSQKQLGSNNRKKQRLKVARIHDKIQNVRRDFLHKASHAISESQAIVVVEDVKIKKMTKSASGTVENPGTNIKQKSKLNKSILDQGWFMFKTMLEYKLKWLGGQLIKINPAYTSQTCNICKHIDPISRISQAIFQCTNCGYMGHADVNAAINILNAGKLQLHVQI